MSRKTARRALWAAALFLVPVPLLAFADAFVPTMRVVELALVVLITIFVEGPHGVAEAARRRGARADLQAPVCPASEPPAKRARKDGDAPTATDTAEEYPRLVAGEFDTMREAVESADAQREAVIKRTRDVQKLSKQAIYSLHR